MPNGLNLSATKTFNLLLPCVSEAVLLENRQNTWLSVVKPTG